MKKLVLCSVTCGLLVLGGVGSLRADEALRRIQQSLRDQGFYYGSIDGAPGDETTQAIRRYQIRNGLAVTGQLNDETRQSIERNGAASSANSSAGAAASRPRTTTSSAENDRRSTVSGGQPSASATPPPLSRPPTVQPTPPRAASRPNDEEDDEDAAPVAPQPPRTVNRPDLRIAPPPTGASGYAPQPQMPNGGILPSPTLTTLFENTPYEFAPPAVQADILRRAQYALLRGGFYGGAPDGVPGAMTAQALAEFQGVNGLRRTARLDTNTLAYLRLLPSARPVGPRGPYGGGPRPHVIYEGRIAE